MVQIRKLLSYIERINRSYHEEVLDAYVFSALGAVLAISSYTLMRRV